MPVATIETKPGNPAEIFSGIALCLVIALPAWFLGMIIPVIGGPVIGMATGMLIASLFPHLRFGTVNPAAGIRFTSKKLLQASIILLGFEMNLRRIVEVGGQSLLVMAFTLTAAFLTAFFLYKALKLPGNTSVLIAVGTAICGGSAIAATAPVLRAKDEDVARAISTIFLFNILAVFIFPHIGRLLGLGDTGFGMWAGTAINDTSSVVAAGTAWSSFTGNDTALVFATVVKLTRTLMIVPVTLVLALYTGRRASRTGGDTASGAFSFARIFPWFVFGFIAAAVLNTALPIPSKVSGTLVLAGKFLIVMAMSAIGLNTDLVKLLRNGIKPILLGLGCWISVAAVSLAVQKLMKLW